MFWTRSYLVPPASTAKFTVVLKTEDIGVTVGHFSVPLVSSPSSNTGRVQFHGYGSLVSTTLVGLKILSEV